MPPQAKQHSCSLLPPVHTYGYLRTESGIGAAARGYVRALQHLGVAVSLHDLSHLTASRSEDHSLPVEHVGRADDSESDDMVAINLVCVSYPHFGHAPQALGRYNVGIWAWELPRFPHQWFDRFAYYDEIWV